MITIEELYQYNNFKVVLDELFRPEQLTIENNVLSLSDTIVYHIASKNYNVVKTIYSSFSQDSSVDNEELVSSVLTVDQQVIDDYKQQNNISGEGYYVFCGSRASFAEAFGLSKYSPSINEFIVAVFETMHSLKFVGPGKGRFVIFKPMLDISPQIYKTIVASRKDFFTNASNMKHLVKLLQQDCDYYLDYINKLQQANDQLQEELKKAIHQQYLTTQMTWR